MKIRLKYKRIASKRSHFSRNRSWVVPSSGTAGRDAHRHAKSWTVGEVLHKPSGAFLLQPPGQPHKDAEGGFRLDIKEGIVGGIEGGEA